MDEPTYDRFGMLYCDEGRCRVNTFERGVSGRCPACNSPGEVLPDKNRS